jgi:hypothetical protein
VWCQRCHVHSDPRRARPRALDDDVHGYALTAAAVACPAGRRGCAMCGTDVSHCERLLLRTRNFV